ncbi:hypothetical protein STEG23_001219 [Scotinomys teguina]
MVQGPAELRDHGSMAGSAVQIKFMQSVAAFKSFRSIQKASYQEGQNAAHKIQHANGREKHQYGDLISTVEVVGLPDTSTARLLVVPQIIPEISVFEDPHLRQPIVVPPPYCLLLFPPHPLHHLWLAAFHACVLSQLAQKLNEDGGHVCTCSPFQSRFPTERLTCDE